MYLFTQLIDERVKEWYMQPHLNICFCLKLCAQVYLLPSVDIEYENVSPCLATHVVTSGYVQSLHYNLLPYFNIDKNSNECVGAKVTMPIYPPILAIIL